MRFFSCNSLCFLFGKKYFMSSRKKGKKFHNKTYLQKKTFFLFHVFMFFVSCHLCFNNNFYYYYKLGVIFMVRLQRKQSNSDTLWSISDNYLKYLLIILNYFKKSKISYVIKVTYEQFSSNNKKLVSYLG